VALVSQGATQAEIALALGISQPAVSKLLKRVDARLLEELERDRRRHWVRQDQRLEHLFREQVRAWGRSQAEATKRRHVKTDMGGDPTTSKTTAEVIVTSEVGDPRFLEGARKSLADLRRIHGLDRHTPFARSGADPTEQLTDAELVARIAELDTLIEATAPEPAVDEAVATDQENDHGSES
jgi:hypothetical protein